MDERNDLPEQGERLEFVPWSSYAQAPSPPWAPWLAVLVVVAVAGLVMLAWGRRSSEPAKAAETVASTEPAITPLSTTPVTLLSEADLRVSARHSDDEVAAVAESFVFGYFTIDPQRSSGAAAELAAALGPIPEQASYVEWVRAEGVEEIEPDRFVVTVRFRLILLGDRNRTNRRCGRASRCRRRRPRPGRDRAAHNAGDGSHPGDRQRLDLGEEVDVVAGPGGIPVLAQP